MQDLEENLSKDAVINIKKWLNEPKYAIYKPELKSMIKSGDWKSLEDAFFKVIEFGTGGRRGKTGVGSNRINEITIGESAQALCEYIIANDPNSAAKGIVIGFDTRLTSVSLSHIAAEVVAANGVKTYIFDGFRSTPELSFAIRYLGCAAGIVISASHNPPTDNGFKAYWNDGGQLVSPYAEGVMDFANKVNEIKSTDYNEAVKAGTINIIGDEIDQAYIKTVSSEALGDDRDLNIVYSPLHGTGQTNVLPVLKAVGFKNISVVKTQMVPDGNFPTVANAKPNPEEKAANDLAVAQLMSESADIAITNDPDADRIGVIVRQGDKPIYLSGNQSAALATDYVLGKLKAAGKLNDKDYIVKTIVTTDLLRAIAENYGVKIYDNLLIGFKYIGELITSKEKTGEKFIIGGEESYGLLKGDYIRDKDGATGALPLAEYAAELKKDGKTLYDRLLELYEQYGIYIERLNNMVCPGADGFIKMKHIMDSLRIATPKKVGEHEVTAVLDYSNLERRDLVTNEISKIDCVKGNVLVLEFGSAHNRITIRPSGTEPKLKFYIQWCTSNDGTSPIEEQYSRLENHLSELASELESTLNKL